MSLFGSAWLIKNWKYLEAENDVSNLNFVTFWMLQGERAFTHRLFHIYPFILLSPKSNKSYTNFLQ